MAEEKIEKKAALKKAVSKKSSTKEVAVKKAALKKAVSKKSSTKEVAVKKAPAKKVATKKVSTLSVTLIKSFYGRLPAHRATVNGLGLKRINHTVELQDTPEVRGMINKVSYLLKVEG
jgi:large subunit ribosomal protein L30